MSTVRPRNYRGKTEKVFSNDNAARLAERPGPPAGVPAHRVAKTRTDMTWRNHAASDVASNAVADKPEYRRTDQRACRRRRGRRLDRERGVRLPGGLRGLRS